MVVNECIINLNIFFGCYTWDKNNCYFQKVVIANKSLKFFLINTSSCVGKSPPLCLFALKSFSSFREVSALTENSNIVGGPSIIFKRYAEAGETKIRGGGEVCKNIIGYGANALYLLAIGQEMPSGKFSIEEFNERNEEILLLNSIKRGEWFGFARRYLRNDITNKITITINAGTFSVLGGSAVSTGHFLIGFEASDTSQAVSQVGSLSQRVTTFPEEIYIRGTLGQNSYVSQIDNFSTSNNILGKIDTRGALRNNFINDINQQSDLYMTDANVEKIESYLTYNDINTATPRIIDFNGSKWSYTVGIYSKLD